MTSNGSLPQPECPGKGGCTAKTVTVTVTAIPGTATSGQPFPTSNITSTSKPVPFTGTGTALNAAFGLNILLGVVGFLVFQF